MEDCNVHGGAKLAVVKSDICKYFEKHGSSPRHVFLCAGSNDIFPKCDRTKPRPTLTEEDIDIYYTNKRDEITQNIDAIEERITSYNSKTTVTWCTVPPRLNIDKGEESVFMWLNQELVHRNNLHHRSTPEIHRTIVRYRKYGGDPEPVYCGAKSGRFVEDGVHPTQTTADGWTEEIIQSIRKLIDETN